MEAVDSAGSYFSTMHAIGNTVRAMSNPLSCGRGVAASAGVRSGDDGDHWKSPKGDSATQKNFTRIFILLSNYALPEHYVAHN